MLLYASALWNASFDWIWIKLGIVNMSLKGSYFQCCNRAILLHTSPKLEVYNCSLLARVFMKHKKAAILRFHYIWHKWDHLIRCPGQYFKRRALDLKLILQLRITSLCRKKKPFPFELNAIWHPIFQNREIHSFIKVLRNPPTAFFGSNLQLRWPT